MASSNAEPDVLSGWRTLVLGGSVFVGKHLVDGLIGRGADVAVLNRGRTASSIPDGVERLVADRTDAEQMGAVLAGREWDAVFDVSGFVMAAGGSDIDGLLDLLDGSVGAYVYTSSIMAYDQSWVGRFPWTEDQPSNPAGRGSYGGFKALVEAAILARHDRRGFPGSVARPAAVYGPDNNIFDMELPMFLRLLQHRPILVPHGGLVVGSYGHVDDLCSSMIAMAASPVSPGEVFNVSAGSVDVNTYIATLAAVVGEEPDVVHVPDDVLAEIDREDARPAFGHLFRARHHAMVSVDKLRRLLGVQPAYHLGSGHEHTFAWCQAKGYDTLARPLVDSVWKASWDFEFETQIAGRIRG